MTILPPGTLLQLMYIKERLRGVPAGRFVEVGPGAGHISALLLAMGWRGAAYDLEPSTIEALESRFSSEIAAGRYQAINADWLNVGHAEPVDLFLSCMVMEHFDAGGERAFVACARKSLASNGRMISIVPGSPKHWGIEDEIAGHYRRYTKESATTLLESSGMQVKHVAGLTFPISNMLFPLSNFLVRRSEARKLSLSMVERTKQSGIREVPMKTNFPSFFGLLLNEYTMYPLHLIQKAFRHSEQAMVLYVEATLTQ